MEKEDGELEMLLSFDISMMFQSHIVRGNMREEQITHEEYIICVNEL